MRLLRNKGIHMHRAQTQLNVEQTTKSKLFPKYEMRKKRQRDFYAKIWPNMLFLVFVSRRSNGSPNGFNCAICRKDISFLTRGESEIYRHFSGKTHCLKDRRYRLDHEDVVFTTRFDAVNVSSIPPELRAEIEMTPPVVLRKKNALLRLR